MDIATLSETTINTIVLLAALWELPWMGVAMWRAARNKHLIWFLVFLLVHLLAIPEILYIAFWSKPKQELVKPARLKPVKKAKKRRK